MMKDTHEQPVEEIHRVISGRVLRTEVSVPVELGCVPPSIGVLASLEAL